MSQYYYQQQRQEDIMSLQAMFPLPWTFDLLGGVLDYFNGNMDEAVSKLLTLNEHHDGNPQTLVERLLLSGGSKNNDNVPKRSFRMAPAINNNNNNNKMGSSTASVPKSMLKKAPPPRKSEVVVTMADTFQPAIIIIRKQTRRRVGIPMKLPKDFLRIPKSPLFALNHLDHLVDMPPPEPWHNKAQSPDHSSSLKTTPPSQGTASSKFQAMRSSMNFPTFQKNHDNGTTNGIKQNAQPKNSNATTMLGSMNFSTFKKKQDSSHSPTNPQPNNSNAATTMLSKFSVPKIMTAPTLIFPKITKKSEIDAMNSTNNGTTASKFTPEKCINRWSLASIGTASSLMKKSPMINDSTPSAAAAATTAERPSETAKGWSLGNMSTSMKTATSSSPTINLTSAAATPERPGDTAKRWSLADMSSSLKTPASLTKQRRNTANTMMPAQEQAIPWEKVTNVNRWLLPTISSSLMKSRSKQQPSEEDDFAPPLAVFDLPSSTSSMMETPSKRQPSAQSGPPIAAFTLAKVTYGAIPKLEDRGITLRQLRSLIQDVEQRCENEKWESTESGYPLHPDRITMYDLVTHYILPKTQENACSYIEAALGKEHNEHDSLRPRQWIVSHVWSDSIVHMMDCIEQHSSDRGLDEDTVKYWICALAMNQHSSRASIAITTTDESSLQNPLMTLKVMNSTEGMLSIIDKENIYYKRIWCLWELFLALERSKFLALERSRASFHGDGGHYSYLIDTYTTNEHDKVVGLTGGSVEVDNYRPSTKQPSNNVTGKGPSQDTKDSFLFQTQPCNRLEWSELRTVRQAQFQFQVCFEALNVHLESTQASMEDDTRRIMNSIVQYNASGNDIYSARSHDAEALTNHAGYARVNALIKGSFAAMAYRRALEVAASDRATDKEQECLRKVQSSLSASPIESIEMSFAGCAAFQIRDALKFAETLPISLRRLELDYSFLDFQYAEEFAIGFGRLGENLQTFKLNCACCAKLENLDRLWEELGKFVNLRHLVLVVHPNKKLTSVDKLAEALKNMPKLECLELEFDCYGEYSKLVAMAKGGAQLNNISSTYRNMMGKSSDTSQLHQQFDLVTKFANEDIMMGGAFIVDSSIQQLCRGLVSRGHETKLTSLRLKFLGSLGKKLRSVDTVGDLQQVLQKVRNGLKLFS